MSHKDENSAFSFALKKVYSLEICGFHRRKRITETAENKAEMLQYRKTGSVLSQHCQAYHLIVEMSPLLTLE